MVDALASSDARQNFAFLALPVRGDHKCDGLTDRLASRVAKYAFGTFVPTCNDAVETFATDDVVAGFHDGGPEA